MPSASVAAERGRLVALWTAPPLFALCANLYRGFLNGLGLLLAWSVCQLATDCQRRRIVAAVLGLSVAATCVNPYRVCLLRFLLPTATVPRPDITQWQPLARLSVWGAIFALSAGVGLLSVRLAHRPLASALLVPLALARIAPLVAIRHLTLFGVAVPVIWAQCLAARAPASWSRCVPCALRRSAGVRACASPLRRQRHSPTGAVPCSSIAVSPPIWPCPRSGEST
jgi:hypothetical protein